MKETSGQQFITFFKELASQIVLLLLNLFLKQPFVFDLCFSSFLSLIL